MSLSKYKNTRINLGKLVQMILDIESQVNFLQESKILPKSNNCEKCSEPRNSLEYKKNYVYFKCEKCQGKQSVRHGTILSKSRMSMRRFILLTYTFVQWSWKYSQGDFL